MRKFLFLIFGSFVLTSFCFAQPSGKGIVAVSDGTTTVFPYQIDITGGDVSDGGDGTADVNFVTGLATTYLKLDASNDPLTGNLNLGGYTLEGNTSSGGNLTLQSTSHATKGKILFGTSAYDEVNNRLGIDTNAPTYTLAVNGTTDIVTQLNIPVDVAGVSAADIRYNSTAIALEYYDGSAWHDAGSPKIVYISGAALTDNVMGDLSDGTNWATNKSLLTHIFVTTSATDWDLYLYSDSDATSGLLGTGITLVANRNGNANLNLYSLPYIDNDSASQIHMKFVDNAAANGATVTIYGIYGR